MYINVLGLNEYKYRINSHKCIISESRKLDGHVTKIFSVCFNPAKPNEFISGGWDNILYFWDVRVPSAVRSIPQIFIGGDGLTINKKGTQVKYVYAK